MPLHCVPLDVAEQMKKICCTMSSKGLRRSVSRTLTLLAALLTLSALGEIAGVLASATGVPDPHAIEGADLDPPGLDAVSRHALRSAGEERHERVGAATPAAAEGEVWSGAALGEPRTVGEGCRPHAERLPYDANAPPARGRTEKVPTPCDSRPGETPLPR